MFGFLGEMFGFLGEMFGFLLKCFGFLCELFWISITHYLMTASSRGSHSRSTQSQAGPKARQLEVGPNWPQDFYANIKLICTHTKLALILQHNSFQTDKMRPSLDC